MSAIQSAVIPPSADSFVSIVRIVYDDTSGIERYTDIPIPALGNLSDPLTNTIALQSQDPTTKAANALAHALGFDDGWSTASQAPSVTVTYGGKSQVLPDVTLEMDAFRHTLVAALMYTRNGENAGYINLHEIEGPLSYLTQQTADYSTPDKVSDHNQDLYNNEIGFAIAKYAQENNKDITWIVKKVKEAIDAKIASPH